MEAFPKTIGPIPLSQSANNQIIKNTVTLSFKHWESLDTNRYNPHGSVPAAPGFGSTSDFGAKLNLTSNIPSTQTRLSPVRGMSPGAMGGRRLTGTGSGISQSDFLNEG